MRVQEIISIVRDYFLLALIAVLILAVIFFLGYFIVYKKLSRGKKSLSKKQLFLVGLLTGYVIMVIGVTFLNRGSNYQGSMNLSFFTSYREAWYDFSVRDWQFLYLNIFMFVPFGILLPLLHARFRKAGWTIGMAALFTLSIERHHHSLDVGYVPKGRDATVAYDALDFRFQNTQDGPFLIKAIYGDGFLTIEVRTSRTYENTVE